MNITSEFEEGSGHLSSALDCCIVAAYRNTLSRQSILAKTTSPYYSLPQNGRFNAGPRHRRLRRRPALS